MGGNRLSLRTVVVGWAALLVAGPGANADVPRLIHYQGKLREAGGAPVNGAINLSFKIYPHATQSSSILFEESHADVPVANGLFNVLIGSETIGGIPDSALDAADVFLGIGINFGDELTPRPRIASSPHAIKSKSAEQLVIPDSFTPAATVDGSGNVGIGTPTPAAKLDVDGDGSTVLVPRKSDSGDPPGANGMIYYNAADAKFRAHEDGSWADMRDGSGPASDPCNCPIAAWTLIGTLNTTVAASGGTQPGSIDISDNTREYLIQGTYFGNTERTINSDAATTINVTQGLNNTILTYWVSVLRADGVWANGQIDATSYPNVIRAGASWSSAGTPTAKQYLYINNSQYAQVFTDGTVRLYDNATDEDGAVYVFARTP